MIRASLRQRPVRGSPFCVSRSPSRLQGPPPARADSRSALRRPVWASERAVPAGESMAGPAFVSVRRRERLLRRRSARRSRRRSFGIPPHRTVNLINLDVIYGLSNRLSLDLTVPFAVGSAAVAVPSSSGSTSPQLFQFDASGLGDMSLQAEYWLSNPAISSRITGSVGLGIKAPTGADDVSTTFPSGDQGQSMSPLNWAPEAGASPSRAGRGADPWSSVGVRIRLLRLEPERAHRCLQLRWLRANPDTYSGRLGAAYLLPFRLVGSRDDALAHDEGLVVSLGGRINGVTIKDLIGGGDLLLAPARLRGLRRAGPDLDPRPEHGLRERSGPERTPTNWTAARRSSQRREDRRIFASYLFLAATPAGSSPADEPSSGGGRISSLMPLQSGVRIGPYEVLSPLGAGGMGEVYRARDHRLGRDVAIKVLPGALADDPQRAGPIRARGPLGVGAQPSQHRDDLRDRLRRLRPLHRHGAGPRRVAEGLASRWSDAGPPAPRHRHSARRRTRQGTRLGDRPSGPQTRKRHGDQRRPRQDPGLRPGQAHPPRLRAPAPRPRRRIETATQEGIILGTVGYMSPEQATGAPVDYRSDQFSIGSILYEMATSSRAFDRASKPQTLAAIIQDEPEPIASRNPRVPPPLRWTVQRCLAKDAARPLRLDGGPGARAGDDPRQPFRRSARSEGSRPSRREHRDAAVGSRPQSRRPPC